MNRRIVASAAAVAALAAGGAATVASADGTGSRAQTAVAEDVTSGPFHLNFNAARPAGQPSTQATGVFDAKVIVAGHKALHLQGPVTCLDVRGNNVGLFYPVSASEPEAYAKFGRGVYIYMRVDGKGHATGIGFSQSVRPYTAGCAPIPAPAPATGHGTADS